MAEMYAKKEKNGFWVLRQRRFQKALEEGKEHPHDVCAVARTLDELRGMCVGLWPDAEYPKSE
jgi:hypothetical protein